MVGITQRVEVAAHGAERRDALDQEWARLLVELGEVPLPLPNRGLEPQVVLDSFGVGALILTGGNDLGTAPERDEFEAALLEEAARRELPVLAVCRGFQMMNAHLGGSIEPVEGHVGAPHEVVTADGAAWARVNSFHNFGIPATGLARELTPLLHAPDGTIEAAAHASLPWLCVMWHPERPNDDEGLQRRLLEGALAGEAGRAIANFPTR